MTRMIEFVTDKLLPLAEEVNDGMDVFQPEPIAVGDEILAGKFKNSKRLVKGFKTDKHGQPVLKTDRGDTQLFKPRIAKLDK